MRKEPALVKETTLRLAFQRVAESLNGSARTRLEKRIARRAHDRHTGVIYHRKGWFVTRNP